MKKLTFSLILALGFGQIQAQNNTDAAGGLMSSSTGSASYSIGQLVCLNASSGGYSLAEGVQQAYEISETLGLDDSPWLKANLSVSPNPSTDLLKLSLPQDFAANLSYQLCHTDGRVQAEESIQQTECLINVAHLPTGMYVLHVKQAQKTIKTFKIIKK
jgi:Secretion system C-terminal sorting domain